VETTISEEYAVSIFRVVFVLVSIYSSVWCHSPKDHSLNTQHYENPKTYASPHDIENSAWPRVGSEIKFLEKLEPKICELN
jgi:hypothetical protein